MMRTAGFPCAFRYENFHRNKIWPLSCLVFSILFAFVQRKIEEAEASRHHYEESRDRLKAEIHGLNSLELKVRPSQQQEDSKKRLGFVAFAMQDGAVE